MRSAIKLLLTREGGSLRLLLIGVLTLLLLLPLAMVESVIQERAGRSAEVLSDVARQHGGAQRLVGPLLALPYVTETMQTIHTGGELISTEVKQRKVERRHVALLAPRELNARAKLEHEVLRRSVYEAPVYRGEASLSGDFVTEGFGNNIANFARADWSKATLVLTVSDLTGLAWGTLRDAGGVETPFAPGAPGYIASTFEEARARAIHVQLALDGPPTGPVRFDIDLGLNGSEGFYLAPIAAETAFQLVGDWPHPSFQGAPLPADRNVDDDGFTARWNVPSLARGYGAIWTGNVLSERLNRAATEAVGFRHARPDDVFVAARRAVKYAVLFVAMTFIACFVLERLSSRRLHPAQYGLVGLSLALFYLLLIALAERIGLVPAYLTAATAIAGMNGAYVGAALRSFRRGISASGALGLLYAAFYVMLASEDDALLIGTGLLLIGLALAMATTTRLNARSGSSTKHDGDDPGSDESGRVAV